MVGGQDELVFDGHSFVLDPTGETIARARQFEEDYFSATSPAMRNAGGAALRSPAQPSQLAASADRLGRAGGL